MTPAAFDALSTLLRMSSSPSREAARLVLVDGFTQADAMRKTGVSRSGVNNAVRACQQGMSLVRVAAELPTQ